MQKAFPRESSRTRQGGWRPDWLTTHEPIGVKARRVLFWLDPGEALGLAYVMVALVADLVVGGPVSAFLVRLVAGGGIVVLAWAGVRALLCRYLPDAAQSEALRTLRSGAALTMSFAVYLALPPVVDYVQPTLVDESLYALEVGMLRAINGGVPLYQVLRALNTPALTAWFSFAYSLQIPCYYFTATVLALKQRHALARNVFLTMALTQYVGFVGYMVWPALGPGVYFAGGPLPPPDDTIVARVVSAYAVARGTFPSLHAAISLAALLTIWLHLRRCFWFALPLVVSLWISTLYLRHHYLPDLLAGWVLATAMVVLAPRLRAWWEARRRELLSGRIGRPA